jgi:hypothetical protein
MSRCAYAEEWAIVGRNHGRLAAAGIPVRRRLPRVVLLARPVLQ